MTQVQHLCLTYNRSMLTEDFAPLASLTSLRCLNLGHVQKDQKLDMDEALKFLSPLTRLGYLCLAWNRKASHAGWCHLPPSLRYLGKASDSFVMMLF